MTPDVQDIYDGGGLLTKSCPTLATPWTVVFQAPLSLGFSRQEDWSGLPFASSRYLPDPGIEPWSPALQADSLQTELSGGEKIEGDMMKFVFWGKKSLQNRGGRRVG